MASLKLKLLRFEVIWEWRPESYYFLRLALFDVGTCSATNGTAREESSLTQIKCKCIRQTSRSHGQVGMVIQICCDSCSQRQQQRLFTSYPEAVSVTNKCAIQSMMPKTSSPIVTRFEAFHRQRKRDTVPSQLFVWLQIVAIPIALDLIQSDVIILLRWLRFDIFSVPRYL